MNKDTLERLRETVLVPHGDPQLVLYTKLVVGLLWLVHLPLGFLYGAPLPFYLLLYGGLMLAGRTKILSTLSTIFFIVLFFDIAIGNSVRFVDVKDPVVPILGLGNIYSAGTELKNGGVLGMIFAILLVKIIGVAGAYIFAGVVALISVILIADKPYAGMVNWQEKSGERAEKRRIKKEKITRQTAGNKKQK